MAKVWKAISSTLAVLLTLALVFGAGYFVGSFPDEEAEIVEPIYADAEDNMMTIIRNFLSGFEDFEIIFL